MRPRLTAADADRLASDFEADGGGVSIESIALDARKTPGTFVSRALDAG